MCHCDPGLKQTIAEQPQSKWKRKKQTPDGGVKQWKLNCLIQSHVSCELPFSSGIRGLVCCLRSHFSKRKSIVGFDCACRQASVWRCSSSSSKKLWKSSQPLSNMCFHYVHVWSSNSFFLCAVALFSAGLGSFPLASSSPVSSTVILLNPESVLLHQLHTLKPTHGPITEAIKLSTSLSPFAGASSSSPQMFFPSRFFPP